VTLGKQNTGGRITLDAHDGYAQNLKIAKPNTIVGAIKPKCLNRINKIDYALLRQQLKTKQQQGNL
jgi:hypothetical protein